MSAFEKLQVRGKRVLLRLDLNVPLNKRKVADATRILAALPTINSLRDRGAKLVICSHLGRPKAQSVPALSLEPVAAWLAEHLDTEVVFAHETVGEDVEFLYEHYDHTVVNPNDARGLVERWLLEVETVMRKAVAYATDCSMEVYEKCVRTTWLKENPGMVVLATAMKVWTHDVEKALPDGKLQGV